MSRSMSDRGQAVQPEIMTNCGGSSVPFARHMTAVGMHEGSLMGDGEDGEDGVDDERFCTSKVLNFMFKIKFRFMVLLKPCDMLWIYLCTRPACHCVAGHFFINVIII